MKTYLLLLALFLSAQLPAQEVLLFDETEEQTLAYRYHHLNGPSASTLRQIIQCLAPNQLHQTAFQLSYAYQLQILEKPEALKVCINWQELIIDRELQPLGFAFADVLYPSSATFNLQLLADGEVVKSECVQLNFGGSLPAHTYNFTNVEGGVFYTLRVNELHFNYGSTQLQAVRQRKTAIDAYLSAKDQLIDIHTQLEALRQTEVRPQLIDDYRRDLHNYREEIRRISNASFWNTLQLRGPNAYDPEDLRAHLQTCRADIQSLEAWLADLDANLHVLYFEEGVRLFEAGNRHAAHEAFCASLRSNDCYAPSHYFLAFLDFEAGKIAPAGQRIIKVLNQYSPDHRTRTDATRLANGIVRYYLDAGQSAVAQRHYPEGVALYEEALHFSESIRGFNFGQAEAISRIKEAYYLDFHDQIDQVVARQRSGQYEVALQQLEQAVAFQRRFQVNSTVDTRRLAAQIVDALYEEQLGEIAGLRRNKAYDQALSAIQKTERLLQSYPEMVRRPLALDSEKQQVLSGKFQSMISETETLVSAGRLDQALEQARRTKGFVQDYQLEASMERESQRQYVRVQQLRYERFVRGGERAQESSQYAQALEQYEAAQQLEREETDIRTDASLASRITSAAVAAAEELFAQSMRTNGSNNERLMDVRGQVSSLANRYGISNHPAIQNIFNQLDDQLCSNARGILLPQQEKQLAREQQAGDYIAARKTIRRIEQLLNTYNSCGLSNASLLMHQSIVEACADYQENLQAAEAAERQGRFGRAIEYYQVAKAAYQDASVQARLSGHPAFRLEQYLTDHTDYHMQLAGAHYYLDQREHAKSLALLNLMLQKGLHPKATQGLQQRLGSALAVRHFVAAANWKETYYGFVSKEERKAYKTMYRSFRKQWKRMA